MHSNNEYQLFELEGKRNENDFNKEKYRMITDLKKVIDTNYKRSKSPLNNTSSMNYSL
jgi:hypothetical protein